MDYLKNPIMIGLTLIYVMFMLGLIVITVIDAINEVENTMKHVVYILILTAAYFTIAQFCI